MICASLLRMGSDPHEYCLHILEDKGLGYCVVCVLTRFIDFSCGQLPWKCQV
jgi:hypothetical protein